MTLDFFNDKTEISKVKPGSFSWYLLTSINLILEQFKNTFVRLSVPQFFFLYRSKRLFHVPKGL